MIRPEEEVDAILLASGFSRRFGAVNKLLVPFRGKPLARHTLDLVCAMKSFRRIFFITATSEVQTLAEGLPVQGIHNEHPEQGQRESIRLGVQASQGLYYMFFPCDQPLLQADTVRRLLCLRQPGAIVQPAFQGQPSSPALFSSVFRAELLSLGPGAHPRDIKNRRPEAVITAVLTEGASLRDIDAPAALGDR
ncbi:MAG: nucleotidyltransferase family protein [Spirochaetaceae bacterium]|jgi:molybdenum cofactor cytidylyltransferase|nr:nucleotidyltransferase family protein [Spirochaetaceae bacterium]